MSHLKKIALGFTCLAGTFNLVSADTKMNQLKPFFTKYCIDCHNAEEQEGDVRLDDMSKFDAELWTDIYDVIDMGDMPPEDESQPTEAHTIAALKLIDEIARDDSVTIASGFRRMNRREYRNTVLDLLGLNKDHFDPAAFVFEDQIEKGFDTNSDSLSISNELLLEYHRAATFSLRAALFTDNPKKPEQLKHTYKGKQIKTNSYIGGSGPNGATSKVRDALIFAPDAASKITASGRYRITFTAAGADHIEQRKDLDYKVGLGFTHNGVNTPTEIFTVVDKTIKFTTHSAELWLEEGAMPYINFASGHPKPRNINRGRARKNLPPIPSPGLTVSNITIEGPIDVEWPPVTYKTIFITDVIPELEDRKVRQQVLLNFMSRAFRRQVSSKELKRYEDYLNQQYKKTGSWIKAYIPTLAAVMTSTDFLYIRETKGKLNSFQLANRLSYFLWSSMPDKELFSLASSGKLYDPEVYKNQLRRMIVAPQAKGFVEGFAKQWLSIDELGSMRPDIDDKKYSVYYTQNIEAAMRTETLTYFKYILYNNRPITEFIDSDYTFLNKNLADLYGIPFDGGKEFELVKLPENSVRGGLIGHGSIHAVTSNGVETLPVERGHWVLSELMGTPPPPPPEEVPAIVPDLTNAKTPKDLLRKHTEDVKCAGCHKLMDPAGLAMESFDIIGRFRTNYGKSVKIDTSGQYDRIKFEDVRGLRKALLKKKDVFTYNLIVKLAEYAKGRKLNRNDKDIVKKIASKAKTKNSYKFMNIMADILVSDLMLDR